MPGLRLMRADEMKERRDEAETTLGNEWRDTLLLQMVEQVARLTKKVSDLEGRERV
jgi:hypothetical protein